MSDQMEPLPNSAPPSEDTRRVQMRVQDPTYNTDVEEADAQEYKDKRTFQYSLLANKRGIHIWNRKIVSEGVIHFLAIATTFTVILINVFQVYWQDFGEDSTRVFGISQNSQLKYFQFATKIHEIFIGSSITHVLMFLLHTLLTGDGIALGLLDAPYLIAAGGGPGVVTQSKFWHSFAHNRRLGLLLFILTVIAFATGPFSAIASK
jgi:hypothetical protein